MHFYYIICFGFKKINKDISTTSGEIMNLFFQKFILQTRFRSFLLHCERINKSTSLNA